MPCCIFPQVEFCVIYFLILFWFCVVLYLSLFSLIFYFLLVQNYLWFILIFKQNRAKFSSCILACRIFCVVFFMSYIFRVVLKSFHSLQHILLLYVCQIFGQNLKKKVSPRVGQLGLIHYPVICLCLFQNDIIVSKLNFMLLLLMLSLISSLHKW